ncbi:MAG: sulfite exporter TauE/SafE family protein [Ignavibacteriae bacterium]|nr:MAG: sulfite exporter TauE/SafE family protein [Ignavibacteriota bacterium]
MINIILYVVLGLVAGILSGLIGIGGGVIIVPALIFIFGLSQHQAQGTTLALLVPPIGILAAWHYYSQGYVNMRIAAFIGIGFILGGLLGAKYATGMSNVFLEKIFGTAMILIGLKMLLAK